MRHRHPAPRGGPTARRWQGPGLTASEPPAGRQRGPWTTRVVYRSATLTAVLGHPPDWSGDRAPIAAFEALGGLTVWTPGAAPFGEVYARRRGLPVIHVIPAAVNWYHMPDMTACLDAVAAWTGPGTLAMGASMGGYAAARFADHLGCAAAVAFAPQFSIRRERVPFERRWRHIAHVTRFQREDDATPRSATVWLVHDPAHAADAQHAALIAGCGPTRPLPIRHGGHHVMRTLAQAKALSGLVDAIRADAAPEAILADVTPKLPASPRFRLHRAMDMAGPGARRTAIAGVLGGAPGLMDYAVRLGRHMSKDRATRDVALDVLRACLADAALAPELRAEAEGAMAAPAP